MVCQIARRPDQHAVGPQQALGKFVDGRGIDHTARAGAHGIDAPQGHVSFVSEVGAHAGPSRDELETFIVVPGGVTLPLPITHPIQLYPHFVAYQTAEPAA